MSQAVIQFSIWGLTAHALRPHGRSLPGAAHGATSYEAIALVDETLRNLLDRTSLSPNKGVTQLLLCPFNMVRPPLSSERGQCGHCSLLPNGYNGCLFEGLRHGSSH